MASATIPARLRKVREASYGYGDMTKYPGSPTSQKNIVASGYTMRMTGFAKQTPTATSKCPVAAQDAPRWTKRTGTMPTSRVQPHLTVWEMKKPSGQSGIQVTRVQENELFLRS